MADSQAARPAVSIAERMMNDGVRNVLGNQLMRIVALEAQHAALEDENAELRDQVAALTPKPADPVPGPDNSGV